MLLKKSLKLLFLTFLLMNSRLITSKVSTIMNSKLIINKISTTSAMLLHDELIYDLNYEIISFIIRILIIIKKDCVYLTLSNKRFLN